MNHIIRNLSVQNYVNFYRSFDEARNIYWDQKNNRLTHSAEYGTYREDLIKKWLGLYIPQNFGISSGFVVSHSGAISTQCDIIIYDKTRTPALENLNNQRFFPVETVCAVGEVKSDIASQPLFSDYLRKLAKIKQMRADTKGVSPYFRDTVGEYNPISNPFDTLFTFLVCKKLKFNLDKLSVDYGGLPTHLHHNAVLSLDDGLFAFKTHEGVPICYPSVSTQSHKPTFLSGILETDGMPRYVSQFAHYFHLHIPLATLLTVDMALYLADSEIIAPGT